MPLHKHKPSRRRAIALRLGIRGLGETLSPKIKRKRISSEKRGRTADILRKEIKKRRFLKLSISELKAREMRKPPRKRRSLRVLRDEVRRRNRMYKIAISRAKRFLRKKQ